MKYPYGAESRLAQYRTKAEEFNTRILMGGSVDWRYFHKQARGYYESLPLVPELGTNKYYARGKDGQAYTERTDSIGEYMGSHDEVIRRIAGYRSADHTGWYTDHYCDGTLIGGVAKLRTPRGTLYIPVTSHSDYDGATHWLNDAFLAPKTTPQDYHETVIVDCARRADQIAEHEADKEREENAKQYTLDRIEEMQEEIKEHKESIRVIREEMSANRTVKAKTLCNVLRGAIREHIRQIRDSRDKIALYTDHYWEAIPSY